MFEIRYYVHEEDDVEEIGVGGEEEATTRGGMWRVEGVGLGLLSSPISSLVVFFRRR